MNLAKWTDQNRHLLDHSKICQYGNEDGQAMAIWIRAKIQIYRKGFNVFLTARSPRARLPDSMLSSQRGIGLWIRRAPTVEAVHSEVRESRQSRVPHDSR